ncbi:tRNA 2-thiouridine(34) synthase MnmA [Prolixibacter denitrificans]|uniref:tRNA-specific 2-thiouridylase MnmA n=1 Tax=Prolixibacter denitrificans TaxID=1541063 RepID=A0A2P8C7X4_9BACT|nr:tRNA 2-thiouridine(34) synthase MnmA [Prolixibacter denitrificans]PSK81074.1 tRNA-specific 2-thiouridylase [Prolixibacter denitrificans]GET22192.1 tRNA-specific 2-thiouridylase MnmA 2 [Prolixibacter denitrificans]
MNSKSVLLGMSGGADSSVAAMLLKEQGYVVTGVTFRMFDNDDQEPEFVAEAKALAKNLQIPHYVMDIREEFEQTVIHYFENEYLAGRTPNPCVFCNNHIKWEYLAQKADELGIAHLATGHYARIIKTNDKFFISRGKDPDKEQSFFLWDLPQKYLQRIVFPLGELNKTEVRKIAADRGFKKVSGKKDSMGICFVPGDYRPFLEKRLVSKQLLPGPGNFVSTTGEIIGRHKGYVYYTIGQRRGLGIHLNKALYVTAIRPEANEVVIGSQEDLMTDRILLKDYHLVDSEIALNTEIIVRIRYRKQATPATLHILNEKYLEVKLSESIVREAAGQTATFYLNDKVLGGGWIVDEMNEE